MPLKRFTPAISIVLLLAFLAGPIWAAAGPRTAGAPGRPPAVRIAETITLVTGIAISPLLATGAYGAYQYYRTPESMRGDLPWYAQRGFWLPALIIVAACAAKDAFGAAVPTGLKKPLDALETLENTVSGLIAAGVMVPFTMSALSEMILGGGTAAVAPPELGGLAMIQLAAVDGTWLLNLLTVPFGMAVFVVVWMASNAINALILLSPWGAIDAVLKLARTAVLSLLTLSAVVDPWLGALLSAVIILLAWAVSGWSFRLTVFSTVFCWDLFTSRRDRFKPAPDANLMFASGRFAKVPSRTYGRLIKEPEGRLVFAFRPWLWMAEQRVEVPPANQLAVGRGLFFSMIDAESSSCFTLPPRDRDHEDELVQIYGFKGTREAGLRKAWAWIRETMGARPVRAV